MTQAETLPNSILPVPFWLPQLQNKLVTDVSSAWFHTKEDQPQPKVVYVPFPMETQAGTHSKPHPTFLSKLTDLLEKHHDDELFGIPELSKLLCLCPMQVHRKVKKLTGLSPGQYLLHFRLAKALHLIINTDYTLGEIAYRTGFSSLNNFSRVFKRVLGCSAGEVRGGCYKMGRGGCLRRIMLDVM